MRVRESQRHKQRTQLSWPAMACCLLAAGWWASLTWLVSRCTTRDKQTNDNKQPDSTPTLSRKKRYWMSRAS